MARPQKALVVDDLAVNRLILGTILHKLGFEVLEAENGLQCIDVYNQERMELVCIFLDLQMPVADGWAATKGIRDLESQGPGAGHKRVPVVVCTASCLDDVVEGGETVAQRARTLGADGAVRKPLTTNAVQRILDEFAPHWRQSLCGSEDPSIPSPSPSTSTAATITTTLAVGAACDAGASGSGARPAQWRVQPAAAAATAAAGHCSPFPAAAVTQRRPGPCTHGSGGAAAAASAASNAATAPQGAYPCQGQPAAAPPGSQLARHSVQSWPLPVGSPSRMPQHHHQQQRHKFHHQKVDGRGGSSSIDGGSGGSSASVWMAGNVSAGPVAAGARGGGGDAGAGGCPTAPSATATAGGGQSSRAAPRCSSVALAGARVSQFSACHGSTAVGSGRPTAVGSGSAFGSGIGSGVGGSSAGPLARSLGAHSSRQLFASQGLAGRLSRDAADMRGLAGATVAGWDGAALGSRHRRMSCDLTTSWMVGSDRSLGLREPQPPPPLPVAVAAAAQ